MTDRLILNWKLDGFVDEQRYYCSETPIDTNNLPTPKAILAGDLSTYTDIDVSHGTTYHILLSAKKGSTEKFGEQIIIEAGDQYAANVIYHLKLNGNAIDEKGHIFTHDQTPNYAIHADFGEALTFSGEARQGIFNRNITEFDNLSGIDHTIEFFAKIRAGSSGTRVAVGFGSHGRYSPSSNLGFWIGLNSGEMSYSLSTNGTGQATQGVSAPHNLPSEEWFHFAVTRNANGETSLFANGVLLQRSTISNLFHFAATGSGLSVGVLNFQTSSAYRYPFLGEIDEVRVTKGVIRYIDSFAPPAHAFSVV